MTTEEFSIKNLFLSQPLICCGGTKDAISLDCIADFMARSDAAFSDGINVFHDGCNSFELIFSFEPGGGEGQYDVTADMMLPKGTFCGYGVLSATSDRHTAGMPSDEPEVVPAGKYLFVQSFPVTPKRIRAAAEALWLESLWEEIPVTYLNVFVRVLKESAGWVFQVLRQTL